MKNVLKRPKYRVNNQQMHLAMFMMYFIHNFLTNIFRVIISPGRYWWENCEWSTS